MKFLFILALLITSNAFGATVTITPEKHVNCKVKNYNNVNWIIGQNVKSEDKKFISIEFLTFYGSCKKNIRKYREFRTPHVKLFTDNGKHFGEMMDVWGVTYKIENVRSPKYSIKKITIKVPKSLVKKDTGFSLVYRLMPRISESSVYSWEIDINKDVDQSFQVNFNQM
jgi:hypothetical protein